MKNIFSKIGKINRTGFLLIGGSALLLAFVPMKTGGDQKWVAPANADKVSNPVGASEANLASGKDLFNKTCAICHGKKGKGDGPKTAELDKPVGDFTKEDFGKQSDGAIFWKITEGNKPMPSFKKEMTEEQRWLVVNYIKLFASKKK
jgi:mono/diheme cytochrome c family protein